MQNKLQVKSNVWFCEAGSSFKAYAHKLALADWNEGDKL
jgi:hypothetical protein